MSDAGPVWDTTDVRVQVCDIVTASADADSVVLAFGTRDMDDLQVQAFAARLLRRIALRPESARHLREMLGHALSEGAKAPPPHG